MEPIWSQVHKFITSYPRIRGIGARAHVGTLVLLLIYAVLPLTAYADNISVTEGSGKTVGFDDITGVNIQRVKPIFGADGTSAGDVATTNPFPIQLRNSSGTEIGTSGAPVQCTLANTGANATAIKVDGSAVTQPVSGTFWQTTQPVSLASVPSHAVTNAGTFVTQENGALLTSAQLIDDGISTTGSAVPAKGFQCTGTDGTNARAVKTDSSGELQIDVLTMPTTTVTGTITAVTAITNALPAGNNNIGDVDVASIAAGNNNIGDVDVASIAAGTNTIGGVRIKPDTAGGFSVCTLVSGASTNASSCKASAGQVFGWYIRNRSAGDRKVMFHDTAGTPTAGASTFFPIDLPAGSAANAFNDTGIPFTSGIAFTTVTGAAASDNTGVSANDLLITIFFK